MTAWVAAACAVSAGALTCVVPSVVRRLPSPVGGAGQDAGTVASGEEVEADYAAVAGAGWFLPVGLLVSVLTAGLLGATAGADPVLLVLVPLVPLGYALAVIDAQTRRIPSRLVVPATLAVAAALVVEWAMAGDLEVLARAGVGLVLARTGFWLMWFVGGLGFGDVRLAALTGLVTARVGWSAFTLGIFAALVLALIFALTRTAVSQRSLWRQPVPMGPFLILGAWVGLMVGVSR